MDPFPNQEVSTGARDNHGNRKECQNEQENIFPNVSQLGDCVFYCDPIHHAWEGVADAVFLTVTRNGRGEKQKRPREGPFLFATNCAGTLDLV